MGDNLLTDEEELDADLKHVDRLSQLKIRDTKSRQQHDGILRRFASKLEKAIDHETVTKNASSSASRQGQEGHAGNNNMINRIFISYSWHFRKAAVHEVAKRLMQQPDFKMWIDMDNISGSTFESMAKGIDESDILLAFFSKEYAISPNCRREIEYAANKNKEILPIRVEAGYRPDGWLLFIFKSQVRLDFGENDDIGEVTERICNHLRSALKGRVPSAGANKREQTKVDLIGVNENFKIVGVPFFSKSKYFNRPEDEKRLLRQIQQMATNPDDGCLVVSGDGGVGKTTLFARLIVDPKNHLFFNDDCNFHRAIWLNCFDWREVFDEKAFIDKIIALARELEADDENQPPNFSTLQGVNNFFKKKRLRVAFILDDVFNSRILQFFMEKLSEPPVCVVITRDAQSIIETNFALVQRVERVEELNDFGIRDMLKETFKLNRLLLEEQIFKLTTLCCGLPLIASLIAARINNCEDKAEANAEFAVLVSPQSKISELRPQNRSFKTVSSLFTFSLDQMDASLRSLYYAFLLFNPAEPVSIFDLGALWGFELDESSRCGLRGVCRAFEKRSLVRRVKKKVLVVDDHPISDETKNNNPTYQDDASEDRFLVHQMLYEAALQKAKCDFQLTGSDDECHEQIRVKLLSGEFGSAATEDYGKNAEGPGLIILIGAIKFHRRHLLERIINKLSAKSLAQFCMKRSSLTDGMPFLHYLYNFDWKANVRNNSFASELEEAGMGGWTNFNSSYRIIKRVFAKLAEMGGDGLLWKVVSERQTGTYRSLLSDVLDDGGNANQLIDRIPLLTRLGRWYEAYSELKWEQRVLSSNISPALVQKSYQGDSNEVLRLLEEDSLSDEVLGEALLTAARRGHLLILTKLLEKFPRGVTCIEKETNRIPLMLAAKNGHLDALRLLYEARPETTRYLDVNRRTAIFWAAMNGHLNCVKFFYEKDPDSALIVDNQALSVLMTAAAAGRLEVVKFLCEHFSPQLIEMRGGDLLAKGTAIVHAASNGQIEVMNYLYDKYKQADYVKAITLAAGTGQLESVKFFHERDPTVARLVDSELHFPSLMMAAGNGHLNVVEYLYGKSDTSVNFLDVTMTAMMLATSNGHLDVVQFLHSKDPEMVKITAADGENALTLAEKMGHHEIVQFLNEIS